MCSLENEQRWKSCERSVCCLLCELQSALSLCMASLMVCVSSFYESHQKTRVCHWDCRLWRHWWSQSQRTKSLRPNNLFLMWSVQHLCVKELTWTWERHSFTTAEAVLQQSWVFITSVSLSNDGNMTQRWTGSPLPLRQCYCNNRGVHGGGWRFLRRL